MLLLKLSRYNFHIRYPTATVKCIKDLHDPRVIIDSEKTTKQHETTASNRLKGIIIQNTSGLGPQRIVLRQ